ncbi:MAG: MscS Mechanosensitive ion channel, partial [Veillonella dispar DORA_11]
MANFLSAVSEFLFKDANILIQIRDWFFAQAGNILLALILFWIGRYAIKWVKAFA